MLTAGQILCWIYLSFPLLLSFVAGFTMTFIVINIGDVLYSTTKSDTRSWWQYFHRLKRWIIQICSRIPKERHFADEELLQEAEFYCIEILSSKSDPYWTRPNITIRKFVRTNFKITWIKVTMWSQLWANTGTMGWRRQQGSSQPTDRCKSLHDIKLGIEMLALFRY